MQALGMHASELRHMLEACLDLHAWQVENKNFYSALKRQKEKNMRVIPVDCTLLTELFQVLIFYKM